MVGSGPPVALDFRALAGGGPRGGGPLGGGPLGATGDSGDVGAWGRDASTAAAAKALGEEGEMEGGMGAPAPATVLGLPAVEVLASASRAATTTLVHELFKLSLVHCDNGPLEPHQAAKAPTSYMAEPLKCTTVNR